MGVDGEQLATAYRRDARALLVFFARRTYDAQAAADLVAETFASALEGQSRFRGASDDELSAWLHGIARNQLARYFRRGSVERRALARVGIAPASLDDEEIERMEELAVLPMEVVNAGDRGSVADRAVASLLVVVAQPVWQCQGAVVA